MQTNTPQNLDHLNETMLYKCPGPHEIHGGHFDYVIVPEVDIEEAKAQGWHQTTAEARAAFEQAISTPPPAPAPYQEPVAQADDLQPTDTAHLMSSQANAEHLEKSIEQANAGQVHVRKIIEDASKIAGVDLTPQEQTAPPTYDEMKAQAKQMGLEFQGNISKAALLAMINAKLAEQV